MPSEVLVAIIGLLGSAIGTFGGIMATSRLTNYRIEQLESKVEKHNNLIERTYKLEESEEVLAILLLQNFTVWICARFRD